MNHFFQSSLFVINPFVRPSNAPQKMVTRNEFSKSLCAAAGKENIVKTSVKMVMVKENENPKTVLMIDRKQNWTNLLA